MLLIFKNFLSENSYSRFYNVVWLFTYQIMRMSFMSKYYLKFF
jgi:hypothetical protein